MSYSPMLEAQNSPKQSQISSTIFLLLLSMETQTPFGGLWLCMYKLPRFISHKHAQIL